MSREKRHCRNVKRLGSVFGGQSFTDSFVWAGARERERERERDKKNSLASLLSFSHFLISWQVSLPRAPGD
jgi:hypothetical protein